ncbi:SRPBCC family protein [Brevifollis gellanilyticus]|uniref:Coenzyme Q-binding protein COQ10 START domain-containing protein n=1 Tax=Brevifollis gellanilyticus TaxID=748831 RepID=A0A512MH69_9BACT|nr:SRPBCC family protein [Brevifollis gellanilyticus]GEP46083.1 hypothetical protein BGE01nite_53740 [Brevifollis gellanilyticus]
MPATHHASTRLAASAEVMFEFHSDPRNIVHVMPFTFRLVSVEMEHPPREGGLIHFRCRDLLIIPMRWTCRWQKVRPPRVLIDEMLEGPFKTFVHEHRFEPHPEGGCVMHDTVTYAFGRGWIGWLITNTAVRLYIRLLFGYRHARTRKWAAKHSA